MSGLTLNLKSNNQARNQRFCSNYFNTHMKTIKNPAYYQDCTCVRVIVTALRGRSLYEIKQVFQVKTSIPRSCSFILKSVITGYCCWILSIGLCFQRLGLMHMFTCSIVVCACGYMLCVGYSRHFPHVLSPQVTNPCRCCHHRRSQQSLTVSNTGCGGTTHENNHNPR